jgi:putative sterol carrier protein
MWFNKTKKESDSSPFYFTEAWMQKWKDNIENSKGFKRKASGWNAPLILKFDPLPDHFEKDDACGIYLELKYGECRELRVATKGDEDRCDVILKADPETWIHLMKNESDLTPVIRKGKVSLEKGSLILLSTQRKAAVALLQTAPVQEQKIGRGSESIQTDKSITPVIRDGHILSKSSAELSIISNKRDTFEKLSESEQKWIRELCFLNLTISQTTLRQVTPLLAHISDDGTADDVIRHANNIGDKSNQILRLSDYIKQTMGENVDIEKIQRHFFNRWFYIQLPELLNKSGSDQKPIHQLKAFAGFYLISEGVIEQSVLNILKRSIQRKDTLPLLNNLIEDHQRTMNESMGTGTEWIRRIMKKEKSLSYDLQKECESWLTSATHIIQEWMESHEASFPFGMDRESILSETITQYQKVMMKAGL